MVVTLPPAIKWAGLIVGGKYVTARRQIFAIFRDMLARMQEDRRLAREAAKAQVAADREARNAAEEEAASASEPDEPQPAAAPCTLRNSFINIMSYCRLASSCLLGHDEGERPHPRMPGRDQL